MNSDLIEKAALVAAQFDPEGALARLIRGGVSFPMDTYDVPLELMYGFPPTFLPVVSNQGGPGSLALKCPLSPAAPLEFVRYSAEGASWFPIAHGLSQFGAYIVAELMDWVPWADEQTEQTAVQLGVCDVGGLAGLFTEDELFEFSPISRTQLGPTCARDESTVEGNLQEFDAAVRDSDFERAWSLLQSNIWKPDEVRGRVETLMGLVPSAARDCLALWLEVHRPIDLKELMAAAFGRGR